MNSLPAASEQAAIAAILFSLTMEIFYGLLTNLEHNLLRSGWIYNLKFSNDIPSTKLVRAAAV
jgi:hypothetical protein